MCASRTQATSKRFYARTHFARIYRVGPYIELRPHRVKPKTTIWARLQTSNTHPVFSIILSPLFLSHYFNPIIIIPLFLPPYSYPLIHIPLFLPPYSYPHILIPLFIFHNYYAVIIIALFLSHFLFIPLFLSYYS